MKPAQYAQDMMDDADARSLEPREADLDIDPETARMRREADSEERMAEIEAREAGCNGHPAGPYDPMGSTTYCDGSCRWTP